MTRVTVVPEAGAKRLSGTHSHRSIERPWSMGPRLRGDDSKRVRMNSERNNG
jgi:hypothetical protein